MSLDDVEIGHLMLCCLSIFNFPKSPIARFASFHPRKTTQTRCRVVSLSRSSLWAFLVLLLEKLLWFGL